ncbi:MAG: SDR family oxidoreductase [Chloroflexi bacterium]|nr:SDR family oxidoreductase [Chloroflexota bacterium]
MDLGLKGKSVIITGGAAHIGRAITLAFAREGANVAIADIDMPQAEKVTKEVAKLGTKGIAVKTDVTKFEDAQKMAESVITEFNSIDVLVNNAGFDQAMPFTSTTPEIWDKIININYRGTLNCTKVVLDHMIQRRQGAIVNISSDAGRMGENREAVYSGTKGAVISFAKAIARENGRFGIRANAVCPGMTLPDTEEEFGEHSMWKVALPFMTPEMREKSKQSYPLKKIGTSQDVAYAVVFLASPVAAGHITGQTLSVSGGYTMI